MKMKKQDEEENHQKKEGVPLDTLGTPIYGSPQYRNGRVQ
jgi:hypothetical protein